MEIFYTVLKYIIETFFEKYQTNITNFLIYIILLGLNIAAFILYGSKLNERIYQSIKLMFIVFDFGSIIIILLTFCFKNKTNLLFISTVAHFLILIFLEIKYKNTRYLEVGLGSVIIYSAMNYNFIQNYENNKDKKMNISIFSLPCFLNIYFILVFSLVIIIISFVIKYIIKKIKNKK